jgi:hypothetical protein
MPHRGYRSFAPPLYVPVVAAHAAQICQGTFQASKRIREMRYWHAHVPVLERPPFDVHASSGGAYHSLFSTV